MQLVRSNLL